MRYHNLKTWPSFFEAILSGKKTFELRKNDRDFAEGDELILQEWDPAPNKYKPYTKVGYTGREILAEATYIFHGGRFGLPDDLCIIGIRKKYQADEDS